MVLSEIITLMIYAVSIIFLPEYFGPLLLPECWTPLMILYRPRLRYDHSVCLEGCPYCYRQRFPSLPV